MHLLALLQAFRKIEIVFIETIMRLWVTRDRRIFRAPRARQKECALLSKALEANLVMEQDDWRRWSGLVPLHSKSTLSGINRGSEHGCVFKEARAYNTKCMQCWHFYGSNVHGRKDHGCSGHGILSHLVPGLPRISSARWKLQQNKTFIPAFVDKATKNTEAS